MTLSNSPYHRPTGTRSVGTKLVIGCEDRKSGRYYLDDLRSALRLPRERIVLIPHACTDPAGIVAAVRDERERLKRERAFGKGDSAWAVFDGDEHRLSNPKNWNDAVQRATSWGIQLAISNPRIELWYLLHFQDQFAAIHRDAVCTTLKRHVTDYDKAMRVYGQLKERTEEAMDRAHQLHELCTHHQAAHRNPSTMAYLLVKELLGMVAQGAGAPA